MMIKPKFFYSDFTKKSRVVSYAQIPLAWHDTKRHDLQRRQKKSNLHSRAIYQKQVAGTVRSVQLTGFFSRNKSVRKSKLGCIYAPSFLWQMSSLSNRHCAVG